MRVLQILPTISFGDAVGNDTIAIHNILKKKGYDTAIYAENVDSRLQKGTAEQFSKLKKIESEDIIIYHLSTGTKLNEWIKTVPCCKVCIYHNITPPDFFREYSEISYGLCGSGLQEVRNLKDTFDCVWADSEFNKNDLIQMGYTCPISVLPILIPFEDYEKKPNELTLKKYDDDYVNILFLGRIAPNKKQENVIAAFDCYQRYYNPRSRLFLVGSYSGMENYYERLNQYVKQLGNKSVYFTGQIKFDEILAFYKLADIFLCMSEHEGFCVPLVEAMCFETPIVAYDSCAIKYTLGGSGILLRGNNPVETAGIMNQLMQDSELRKKVIDNQNERLKDFDNKVIEEQFWGYLKEFMEKR